MFSIKMTYHHTRSISSIYWTIGTKLNEKEFINAVINCGYLSQYDIHLIRCLHICMKHMNVQILSNANHMWIYELYLTMKYPSITDYVIYQLNNKYTNLSPTTCKQFTRDEISDAFMIMNKIGINVSIPLDKLIDQALEVQKCTPSREILFSEEINNRHRLYNDEMRCNNLLTAEFISTLISIQRYNIAETFIIPVVSKISISYDDACRRVDEVMGNIMPPAVNNAEYQYCRTNNIVIVYRANNQSLDKFMLKEDNVFKHLVEDCDEILKCNLCSTYKGSHKCHSCVGIMCDSCYNTSCFKGKCPFCRVNM